MVKFAPPVIAVNTVLEGGIAQEEVVKELFPSQAAFLRSGSNINLIIQLALTPDVESVHELWVFRKLRHQVFFSHVSQASKVLVFNLRILLNVVEDPLEKEKGHLVFRTDAKHLERVFSRVHEFFSQQHSLVAFRHQGFLFEFAARFEI